MTERIIFSRAEQSSLINYILLNIKHPAVGVVRICAIPIAGCFCFANS